MGQRKNFVFFCCAVGGEVGTSGRQAEQDKTIRSFASSTYTRTEKKSFKQNKIKVNSNVMSFFLSPLHPSIHPST
jgi:hypothetical protein